MEKARILIGIGGGIAAYKVCEVVSQLFQRGAEVRVILTDTAQHFITPLTVATLSRHPAYTDQDFWQPIHHRPLHIELGEWAELLLIAPLTANTLGKLALGLADNLLTNTVLASRCPILLAPAMNTDMGEQVAVQRNETLLRQDPRYHWLDSGTGLLACDRRGKGRMAEPIQILKSIESLLWTVGKRDLVGKHLLITGGGTREYLDPVRFIGNPASGKMGIALVQAALDRGATVTFITGPLTDPLPPSENLKAIAVTTADQMEKALKEHFPQCDWLIMAAAVADVKPASYSPNKLPKNELPASLPLAPVPDLVAQLTPHKQAHQTVIGFAAQTGDIITPAKEKLQRKGLDWIVANPIDLPQAGFGTEQNQAVIIHRQGQEIEVKSCSKLELAHRLYDCLKEKKDSQYIESHSDNLINVDKPHPFWEL